MEPDIPERDYEFPYPPYDIQIRLMNIIYQSLDQGKVALIESPTGTGKSLSIICSVLKWISDFKIKKVDDINKQMNELNLDCFPGRSNDWVFEQTQKITNNNKIDSLKQSLDMLNKHINYSKDLRKNFKSQNLLHKYSKVVNSDKRNDRDDELYDDENQLIVQYNEMEELDVIEDEKIESNYYQPKVFYCSRTHSQLSQFINEVKKTKKSSVNNPNSLMLLPLSSRVNYCINPNVTNLFSNVNMINEKCNQIQNSKSKCSMSKYTLLNQLNEEILSSVYDLEDIVAKGKLLKACPYYASRISLNEAEIVTLPYNILLHKGTRESIGIRLKDSIVIVDEAHNLLETITNIYTTEIRHRQLEIIRSHLVAYMNRYYTRFNSLNLMYLKQLIFITKRLIVFLKNAFTEKSTSFEPLDFVLKLEIEHINIYKLIDFIDKSHIASKLYMFSCKPPPINENTKKIKIAGTKSFLNKLKNVSLCTNEKSINEPQAVKPINQEESFSSNMLYSLKEFLLSIKNFSVDGKILLNLDKDNSDNSSFKYLLLNPSSHFKDILVECKSVILCGGTMKPFEDFINQLFKPVNVESDRILTFSCDHVIQKRNLIAIGCGIGPTNVELNYTFANRSSKDVIHETGLALVNYCQVIPKGVVVFFPSYDYEEFVLQQWQQTGILKMISNSKRIFKEPKKSSLTSNVLSSYSKFIKTNSHYGAVLFSVVGGKMSEGINFSDDLGRGVIVIGLPYANRNSIELKEKMSYLDRVSHNLSNEYYENLCMRAVNQSIGRAIRHKDDYAAIILLDNRYCTKEIIKNKLSNWIQSRFYTYEKYSQSVLELKSFFNEKK